MLIPYNLSTSHLKALKVRFASNCEIVEKARVLSSEEKGRKIE